MENLKIYKFFSLLVLFTIFYFLNFGIIGVEILSSSVLVPEHAATRGAALRAAYKTNPSVKCIARSMVSEFSYRHFFVSFGASEFTSVVEIVDSLPSHRIAFIQRNPIKVNSEGLSLTLIPQLKRLESSLIVRRFGTGTYIVPYLICAKSIILARNNLVWNLDRFLVRSDWSGTGNRMST